MMRTPHSHSSLPPGFRFHPTDEELIFHYLSKKVESIPLPVSIIAEVDIYKFDPWDLPGKALFGEKEWYFFSPRDRKYPNGARPNRAAASGYWKATGTDKTIKVSFAGAGVKKALVFYKGRPPKGIKTNWIMHEYRLIDSNQPIQLKYSSMRLDDWVLCRIYKKTKYVLPSTPEETMPPEGMAEHQQFHQQFLHDDPTLLSDIKPSIGTGDQKIQNTLVSQKSLSFTNLLDAMDYSLLSSFLSEDITHPTEFGPTPELNGRHMQQQPLLDSSHDSYLYQKLPQLNSASPRNMENRLKRQNPDMVGQDPPYPSKKYVSSCSTTTLLDIPQDNIVNQYLYPPWFTDQKDFTVEHDTKRLENRFGLRRSN